MAALARVAGQATESHILGVLSGIGVFDAEMFHPDTQATHNQHNTPPNQNLKNSLPYPAQFPFLRRPL